MYGRFEYMGDLQYRLNGLMRRLEAFESGEKYVRMKNEHSAQLAGKDREIRRLSGELAGAHRELANMRRNWMDVFEDLQQECAKEKDKGQRLLEAMEGRALRAERKCDELQDRVTELRKERYIAQGELEEERGKNQKLKAQMSRDYENSSIPSSQKPNHRPIPNSRERSGRKPGGQPGHKGHGRKRLPATRTVEIPASQCHADSPDYRPTGRAIRRQRIRLAVNVLVDEYLTPEFRNVRTGQRVHARFPAGVMNDVNYDGSVKAFAFLLNSSCHVSIDKARRFLSDLTGGVLNISKGMVSNLCKEFSQKTKADQDSAFNDLLLSPVMNVDFTSARVNGQGACVTVCATPDNAMYFARETTGHKGVEGTPAEDFQGILVHDHDRTFYNYGGRHQECLAHILRYLKDSMQNEPSLRWNRMMWELVREMIHCRNSLAPEEDTDEGVVRDLEARYDEILGIAREEYDYEPPSDYCRDGYNLSVRLRDYRDSHLLFLHDRRVPSDNNLSERLLRNFKRKQKQMMTFRSAEGLDCLCRCMGVLSRLSTQNQNLYGAVSGIFG